MLSKIVTDLKWLENQMVIMCGKKNMTTNEF